MTAESRSGFQATGRYSVVPRTLCFLFHEDAVLLLRGAPHKWFAGRLNGVGGHVEAGENVHDAALREIQEETGLAPSELSLRAVLHVTSAGPGIVLFVFAGSAPSRLTEASVEGDLVWTPISELSRQPVCDDIELLVTRVRSSGSVQFGTLEYDDEGQLRAWQFTE